MDELEDLLGSEDLQRLVAVLAERDDAVVNVTDHEGRVLWASQRGTQELLGYDSAEEMVGRGTESVHPEDREIVEYTVVRLAEGETTSVRYRARTREGGWRPVRTIAWRIEGPFRAGDPAIVAVTVPDEA